jgi:DNA-binding SARP family transcriptional activator
MAAVEFRVLGPVQVATAAGTVELASGKQVALLACLLVAGGDIVSRDRLIDALWGEQPPAAAVNALQVHMHGLRRRLGPERIELDGPGYRLCLAPGELDLERFEHLVARGRAELARGDAGAAESSLREALGLWRGKAYEDVRYDAFAQPEAARLEELRLAPL